MSDLTHTDNSPAANLRQVIDELGFIHTILLAAKLGIADLLQDGPLSIAELARETDTHGSSLYRLMRALASRGVFRENADGRFALTELADPLRRNAPNSIRTFALFDGSQANLLTWANLEYSVRTGQPAFEHLYGKSWFDYLDEQPELAKIFNDVMTSGTTADAAAIVAAHDFSAYHKIVDVGGGHGALLALILDRNPQASGVLFDAPQVIASARGALDDYLAQGRAEKVAGNFFEAVPQGGDAYVLKFIVHDWDDDRAVTILENCRQAMAENGRVLLVEMIIPPGNVPSPAKFLDLTMLLYLHSRERTEDEYRDLLRQAGLRLVKATPTASPFSIIEAVRA
ncbi:MAG: helix-turn-helix domain-containing protein [Chloroflexota bacterium]|nr:helix-turn-helix domain-containing protein [Chloroflexota bacterium]